jgi:very-short-patch-repair endonuclease
VGPYDVDCYWPQYSLVIEVDEAGHEFTFEEDRARDRFLTGLGLRTMRRRSGRRSDGLRESFADE